ncbi:thiamine biosynthesis protein ThiS [Methyloceanibacter superfactus]|uniref:Thiamine biosynthesis protein ThiS n=1 Tax=Methyloceanibacter superfactus TaxID=1774969 RepID=A0A1E3VXA9_9HYPH|nr:sulfur carrier protein ThiS [Methyloceanibacter superfactus]ODR98160.1 thiamine biosynthesis protein ThiS [Methyloceanibacter superfactus]
MQILLNGERFATDASNLDELCATLGFTDAKVATAVNGSFVASAKRSVTPLAEADEVEIVAPRQGG